MEFQLFRRHFPGSLGEIQFQQPPFPAFSSALFQSVSQEEDAEQIKAEAKEKTPIAGKNEFLILTVL